MVTINLSLRDTALIVMALEEYRRTYVEIFNDAGGRDEQQAASGVLHHIDRVLNRTLDAGEPVVYDALGLKVSG